MRPFPFKMIETDFRPAFVPQGGTTREQVQGSSGVPAESTLAFFCNVEVNIGSIERQNRVAA